jgi:hypothetical protein
MLECNCHHRLEHRGHLDEVHSGFPCQDQLGGGQHAGETTTPFLNANSTTSRTSPGVVKNLVPASTHGRAFAISCHGSLIEAFQLPAAMRVLHRNKDEAKLLHLVFAGPSLRSPVVRVRGLSRSCSLQRDSARDSCTHLQRSRIAREYLHRAALGFFRHFVMPVIRP